MRFLIVTDLPEVGGSSTICLTLMQKLASWGHTVSVLTRWHKGYEVSEGVLTECARLNIEVIWVNAPGGSYRLRPLGVLWSLIHHTKPDMILANGTGWMALLISLLFPEKQFGYYYINHDESALPFKRLKWFSLAVDRFAVITPLSCEPLRASLFISRPVSWLPQFSEPIKSSLPITNHKNPKPECNVGFVGLLSEAKGVPHLLALWSDLQLSAELRFVGKGPFLDMVKKAAVSTGGDQKGRVRYEGAFDARDRDTYLETFFEQVDFLIMPTIMPGEGTPTVILEALAFGVPVLATDEGGTACFNLHWLKATAPCVVEAVPLANLGDALVRYYGNAPFSLHHRKYIKSYYKRFFSDEVVGSRWQHFCRNVYSVI